MQAWHADPAASTADAAADGGAALLYLHPEPAVLQACAGGCWRDCRAAPAPSSAVTAGAALQRAAAYTTARLVAHSEAHGDVGRPKSAFYMHAAATAAAGRALLRSGSSDAVADARVDRMLNEQECGRATTARALALELPMAEALHAEIVAEVCAPRRRLAAAAAAVRRATCAWPPTPCVSAPLSVDTGTVAPRIVSAACLLAPHLPACSAAVAVLLGEPCAAGVRPPTTNHRGGGDRHRVALLTVHMPGFGTSRCRQGFDLDATCCPAYMVRTRIDLLLTSRATVQLLGACCLARCCTAVWTRCVA